MKPTMKKFIALFLFATLWASIAIAQNFQIDNPKLLQHAPVVKKQGVVTDLSNYESPKKPGHYTTEDWQALVDSLWGPGQPTSTKLQIFDKFWNDIDQQFGGFPYLKVNWDSMKTLYRPQIEAGVSQGRFWGITGQLFLALQETHTHITDSDWNNPYMENGNWVYKPGIPMFFISGWDLAGNFGAALTPLPDSSLLVYRAINPHPLDLVPGDVVLGYDRIPWKQLYKELLSAQLPLQWNWSHGSSPKSMTHSLLNSAGSNWGLFDTLDVVKYETGDTLHLATTPLTGLDWFSLLATEQVAVPGVKMPDSINGKNVTWGIVDNTSIGYVYAYTWSDADGSIFEEALKDLITVKKVTGLILDFRYNAGGNAHASDAGLDYLFSENPAGASRWRSATRSDPANHLSFAYSPPWDSSCSMRPDYYDRPIAVLTGPQAKSSGDFTPFRMRFHPMVRFFGLPTSGAFVSGGISAGPVWGTWYYQYATGQMQSLVNNEGFLMHKSFPVDEEVWLTRDGVAKGEDDVVKRALEWINNLSYAHSVTLNKTYLKLNIDTSVIITATVENPNDHTLSVYAKTTDKDKVPVDSLPLFDDGGHGDGNPGDGIWGTLWPVPSIEKIFAVDITTKDTAAGSIRTFPRVARFTFIGPVVFEGITFKNPDTIPNSGDNLYFKVTLRNNGLTASAVKVKAQLTSLDTLALIPNKNNIWSFADIAPGELSTSNMYYKIEISEDCPVNKEIPVKIDISSDGYIFWSDTFSILVREPLNIEDISEPIARIYPNPTNGIINIEIGAEDEQNMEIEIYTVTGAVIYHKVYKSAAAHFVEQVDLSGYAKGIYLVKVITDVDNYIGKISLE